MTKVLSGKELDQAAIDAAIARAPFNAHEKSSVAIHRNVMALMYKDGYKASEAAHADYRALEEEHSELDAKYEKALSDLFIAREELAALRVRMKYLDESVVSACMSTEAVSPDGDPATVISNLIQWHIDTDRKEFGRSRASYVCIKRRQFGERTFDSIRIDVGGLPMYCDLMEGSGGDRQIRMAKRISDDNQAIFSYDEENASRCSKALTSSL